ncbi:hypothetical protein ABZ865_41485 [Streptomyces sp. NPDC047085]
MNGSEHAKGLFAAAMAAPVYVDEKGCEVCPTEHLSAPFNQ